MICFKNRAVEDSAPLWAGAWRQFPPFASRSYATEWPTTMPVIRQANVATYLQQLYKIVVDELR